MINTGRLAGTTAFVTGGSRGIGKAIALKLARDGANVVIAAKTTEPHAKLPGTIYTAAEEIEKAGGKCLPLKVDIRNEDDVKSAVRSAVDKFGGLDILVNNASAISLTKTPDTDMKRFDLMHQVNTRGTFMVSKYAIEFLKKSQKAHILTLSPPLELDPNWFKDHVAYTISKYGMSLCVLGMAAELKSHGIAVNALWPRTAIWTAAMEMLTAGSGDEMCRKDEIVSDAAYAILSKDPRTFTGNFCIDEQVLRDEGVTNFDQYAVRPGSQLLGDFFVPKKYLDGLLKMPSRSYHSSSYFPIRRFCSSTGGGEGDLSTAKIFETMSAKVDESVKNEINAVMFFQISGDNWTVDAHSSRPFKISKEETAKPDVTFITDEETFVKMAKGEVKAANAFMSGKLKVKGNLSIAMKAEKIFGKIRESK